MERITAEQLAERAVDFGLLDEKQLQEVWATFGNRRATLDEFVQSLVRRDFVTNYQLDRLLKGERDGFFYGDYKVLYLIGTGSFARVFRAVHRDTGQVVAVKVLRKRFSDNPAQYTTFLREGELGCTLRHPNIVPVHEVHSYRGSHYLVMEFIEGRNLREFMKIRRTLDPAEATKLMADVTNGLSYAFQRMMGHRDLKMSNILVSSRGQARLLDFGLAALEAAAGEESVVDIPNTRTIDYAALERATGVRSGDPRSDIYFAGCIYYHMLSGRPALVETLDRVQRMNRQRFTEILPIEKAAPNLPSAVINIVNKAMCFDPNHRYQTPRDMLVDLNRLREKFTDGTAGETAGSTSDPAEAGGQAEPPTVMVVESNLQMQDVLRNGLKRAGYRVLVIGDPQRAFDRTLQSPESIACIVLLSQELGEAVLKTFNRLGENPETESCPVILLLGQSQQAWKNLAQEAEHRLVLTMPITMKQLRTTVRKLIPAEKKSGSLGIR
ncbi:MAG: protein kinase domain-containing protein [Thermoguttaceae bacterium]